MDFKMLQASEQAANLLITAQRECEELHISSPEPELQVISFLPENKKDMNRD